MAALGALWVLMMSMSRIIPIETRTSGARSWQEPLSQLVDAEMPNADARVSLSLAAMARMAST